MKKDIFEGYVDKVTHHFDITREQLFTKDKSRHLSDARHKKVEKNMSNDPDYITLIKKLK
jgi:hypothetical protein